MFKIRLQFILTQAAPELKNQLQKESKLVSSFQQIHVLNPAHWGLLIEL